MENSEERRAISPNHHSRAAEFETLPRFPIHSKCLLTNLVGFLVLQRCEIYGDKRKQLMEVQNKP